MGRTARHFAGGRLAEEIIGDFRAG